MDKKESIIHYNKTDYIPYYKIVNKKYNIIYIPKCILYSLGNSAIRRVPYFKASIIGMYETLAENDTELWMDKSEFYNYQNASFCDDLPDFNNKNIYYDRVLGKEESYKIKVVTFILESNIVKYNTYINGNKFKRKISLNEFNKKFGRY